jgi:hypothetical protein
MKRNWKPILFVLISLLTLIITDTAAAKRKTPIGLNVKATKFQELTNVIHILVTNDDGRLGQPAIVKKGRPVLFLFEWGADPGETVADLQAFYIDGEEHNLTLSIDGQPAFSVKEYYQDAFFAETGSGPFWKWDHDGDGPGDGDGDGTGDWNGPVIFFRYEVKRLSKGDHTFTFSYTEDSGATWSTDEILVQVN